MLKKILILNVRAIIGIILKTVILIIIFIKKGENIKIKIKTQNKKKVAVVDCEVNLITLLSAGKF